MYKILSKYNFISILPFSDSFFYITTLPKKVKLSKDLLRFNYLKYSPFPTPNIINTSEKENLLLWFYKNEINTPIIIPESYIAYQGLKLQHKDAIVVIEDVVIKVLVIKDSKLINAFTLDKLDENSIALTMDEVQVFTRVDIDQNTYKELQKKSLDALNIKDIYKFNQLSLDRKSITKTLVEKLSYPLSALIVFAMLVGFVQGKILSSNIEELKTVYNEEKTKNKDIKQFVNEHNSQVKRWQEFIDKELLYTETTRLLDSLYTIFNENEKAHFYSISLNQNNLVVKIQTDINPITFLNRLNEIIYFSRVVIQNSYKPKRYMKIITYDITIKTIKDL